MTDAPKTIDELMIMIANHGGEPIILANWVAALGWVIEVDWDVRSLKHYKSGRHPTKARALTAVYELILVDGWFDEPRVMIQWSSVDDPTDWSVPGSTSIKDAE